MAPNGHLRLKACRAGKDPVASLVEMDTIEKVKGFWQWSHG